MTHPTKVRTFDRETWQRAIAAWDDGRFGSEWADWRNLAGKAGIIFPPTGSPDDSWTDPRPSQRALIIRAIRETPRLLRWAITRPGVASWGDVLEQLLAGRDALGDDADRREADWQAAKDRRTAGPAHVTDTLTTIADSLGVNR